VKLGSHRGGRSATGELADALAGYPAVADEHPYWSGAAPQSMLIDEVEAIWTAISERDDWQPLHDKVAAVRAMGEALGEAPVPGGHSS
jgi:serine/tyrosine/threonine adenylyltransferase